jgi:hypothetical protein
VYRTQAETRNLKNQQKTASCVDHPQDLLIPRWVSDACDPAPNTKRFRQTKVMSGILFYFHPTNKRGDKIPASINVSVADLSDLCFYSRRTIGSALSDLQRLKLIETTSDGRTLTIQLSPYSVEQWLTLIREALLEREIQTCDECFRLLV